MSDYLLVDSEQTLAQMLADVEGYQGDVALDAERASGFKYSQRAYLVQIRTSDSTAYLLDTPALVDLAPATFQRFRDWLSGQPWVLHAATQDLPCLMDLDIYPKAIFDTEVAARLLGLEKVGLAAIVEHYLEISLAKEHSAADWSQRPLSESMLEYAALDVEHLFDLKRLLIDDLKAADKYQMANQEFEHLLSFQPKPRPEQPWRGTGGIHALKTREQLAIVRELWLRREEIAIETDVSPGRIVPDRSIVHAATQNYKSKRELITDKAFNGRGATKYASELFEAIQKARSGELPELRMPRTGGTPNHKSWEKLDPEKHKQLATVRTQLQEISELRKVPIENLINPQVLRDVIWESPEDLSAALERRGVRPWQQELVLPLLLALTAD